ncbi:MAG: DUF4347 domain-containing protein, partial [Pseudomonadales bacterium]
MKKKLPYRKPQASAIFEELEPRVLFSAGVEGLIAGDVHTQGVTEFVVDDNLRLLRAANSPQANKTDAEQNTLELVFLDTDTPDREQLLDDLLNSEKNTNRHFEIIELSNDRNGIEQISETLSNYQDVDAVHIISHGSDGSINLGETTLNANNLTDYQNEISAWSNALDADADILIYGCNLAASNGGEALIDSLSTLTGADIAASTDITGNVRLGGDWDLEYHQGQIDTEIAFTAELQQQWGGTLAEVSGTIYEDINGDGDILDDGVVGADVRVLLYQDDGDGSIDTGDSFVTSVKTDAGGNYSFNGLADDTYWVVVDSKTIAANAGLNQTYSQADIWAEQTYGAAGSVSFNGSYSYSGTAGAFYGGMQGEVSDDASSLTTSEHVIRATISGADVTNVDYGFSFNAITNTTDVTPSDLFTNTSAWSTFDAQANIAPDVAGYSEAVFDGRYVYFVPYHNGSSFHGEVMRYDTHLATDDTAAWSTFDPGFANADGFSGGEFDGRYVYFSPYANGEVLRFDTQGSFTDIAAWDTFDPGTGGGYEGITFDGTYLYFAPWSDGNGSVVLRYDTTADFNTAGSWDTYDLNTSVTTKDGYDGIEFDGRYVYLVPLNDSGNEHGMMVRYDTLAAFDQASSWETYDVETQFGSSVVGFSGAIFDGQYMYYTPLYNDSGVHGTVLRYDTTLGFSNASAWASFDVEAQFGNDGRGFLDQTFDGRYLYLTPYDDGSQFSGNVVRYDTQGSFTDAGSWSEFNPDANLVGNDPRGYWGAIFDGRNVHFVPIRTDWGGNEHGEVLIYDTLATPAGPTQGQGSLRQFIENSNAITGTQSSQFAIPTTDSGYNGTGNGEYTIQVAAGGLPEISDTVVLDGSNQSGYAGDPIIELQGPGGAPGFDGLNLTSASGGSTISGLIINGFNVGIELDNSDGNTIVGNWIGLDETGLAAPGNANQGIEILNSANNTIGGSTAADRNVISGNNSDGIIMWGASTTTNTIKGNYIGVDSTGNAPLGNSGDGIAIGGGANNNTIGGDRTAGEGNVLSGNIGANSDGIEIDNVGADDNKIYGNYIGTNFDGSSSIANARNGVVIYDGVQGTRIGGSGTGQGNIISGNTSWGIVIDGNNVATTSGNLIQGNYIGLDAAGTTSIANGDGGIYIFGGAQGNTVGGDWNAGEGNVISGHSGSLDAGILITGDNTDGNIIRGNRIGTNAAGTAAVANFHGIWNQDADGTVIGGDSTAGLGNLVSGNSVHGVYLDDSTSGVVIQGNLIGTDANGTAMIGNGFDGVRIEGGPSGNTIGGDNTANLGNVISGNTQVGIHINSGSNNEVYGNWIGTNSSGDDLGNTLQGIYFDFNSADNLIGSTLAIHSNVIAYNSVGIGFKSTATGTGNSILRNSIRDNDGLGIDISDNGVTTNDSNDGDPGPNNTQNFPVITQADLSGTNLTVSGTIDTDGPLNTQYHIEFFGNVSGTQDPTHGEGRYYLGTTTVTVNASGDGSFTGVVLPGVTLAAGDFVTATATRIDDPGQVGVDVKLAYGDTSEFAANFTISAVNNVPVATGNTVIASEDVPLVIGSGDFSFTDVESDSLVSVTITGLNLNGGTLTHSAGAVTVTNGMTVTAAQLADLTFTSAFNDSTDSNFTYTVNDAGLGVTSAVMNITVNAVNDVPVATGNTVIASEDVPLIIGVSDFNFTDVELDSLA